MDQHSSSGTEDADLLRIAHERYRRRIRFIVFPLLAMPFVVGVVFTVAELAQGASAWVLLMAPVLLLPVLPALWLIQQQRRGRSWLPGPIRLNGTDRDTRRRVVRSVRHGRLPADEPDRGLGLELARSMDRTGWRIWANLVAAVLFLPALIFAENWIYRLLFAAAILLNLAGWLWEWRAQTRVRTLLQEVDGPLQPGVTA